MASTPNYGPERGFGWEQTLKRLRDTAEDSGFVQTVRKTLRNLRRRWLAFRFTRRVHGQVQNMEPIAEQAPYTAPAPDLTECLFRQSLPAKLHVLVQLRVAAQIASAQETNLRAHMCRDAGWSPRQVESTMIGSLKEDFSEPEQLVLQYAGDMTRTPIDIDPQVMRELRRYFSEAQMIELTASIAHENFRARFEDARNKL